VVPGYGENEAGKIFHPGQLNPDLPYLQKYVLHNILCQCRELDELENIGIKNGVIMIIDMGKGLFISCCNR